MQYRQLCNKLLGPWQQRHTRLRPDWQQRTGLMDPSKHVAWVSIAQFDPFPRVGALHTLLGRLHFFQAQGLKVSVLDFLTGDTDHDAFDNALMQNGGAQVVREGTTCRTIFRGVPYCHQILPVRREQLASQYQSVAQSVERCLEQEGVDYVWTADQGYWALLAARQLQIPGAHFFHTLGNIEGFARNPGYVWLSRKQTVIANSRFLQTKIKEQLSLDALVWYPFVELDAFHCGRDGGRKNRIGFYSVGKIKGSAIVVEIAARMPGRAFLVVGNYVGAPLDNVTYLGYISDMRQFYREIDVLLVPSVWEEPFGRVILEAAVNGIPVIANRVGGIPEAMGESGILIDLERDQDGKLEMATTAEKYVQSIHHLLDDDTMYSHYQEMALARAETYENELTQQGEEILDRTIRR